jgi:hypothetical protein
MKKSKHRTSNVERRTSDDRKEGAWELHDGSLNGKKYDLEDRLLEFQSSTFRVLHKVR